MSLKILTKTSCKISPFCNGKPLRKLINEVYLLPGSKLFLPDCVDTILIEDIPPMSPEFESLISNL